MIVIDKYSRKPIYEQIIDGIEKQIMSGVMGELDKLPSIRELSVALSINPNTIQKAFLVLINLYCHRLWCAHRTQIDIMQTRLRCTARNCICIVSG